MSNPVLDIDPGVRSIVDPKERRRELMKVYQKNYVKSHIQAYREYHRAYRVVYFSDPKNRARHNEWEKEWRKRNPEKVRESKRLDYLRHRENYKRLKKEYWSRRVELLNRLKTSPCVDCGVQYNPWIMNFDHRNPEEKVFCPSSSCSIELMEKELKKCDIVCSNCHAERTHNQRMEGKI